MKKVFSVLLSFVLLLSLVGCSGGTAPVTEEVNIKETVSNNKSFETEVEIEVAANFIGNPDAEIELVWQPNPYHWLANANDSKKKYLIPRVTEWAEAHPNVKIKVVDTTTTIQDAMAKTLIQTASGQPVDMAAIDSYVFPNFYQFAKPMTSALKAEGIESDDFFPYVQNVTTKDGEILGLWYTTDVRFIYYRKDLIDTPPSTWEELMAVCEEIKDDVSNPYIFLANRSEGTMTNTILPYFFGQGGKLFDELGNPVFGEGNNRQYMLNAVNFSKEMIDNEYSPIRVTSTKLQDFYPDVAAGQVGIMNAANFNRNQLLAIITEDDFNEKWGIAPIPMAESGQRSSIAGGWVSAILTEDPEKHALCEDFLLWMYGNDEGMSGWCKSGGYLPTRKSIYEKDTYFGEGYFMEACVDELEYADVRPPAALYPETSTELQVMFGAVLTGEMGSEDALDLAFENVKNSAE